MPFPIETQDCPYLALTKWRQAWSCKKCWKKCSLFETQVMLCLRSYFNILSENLESRLCSENIAVLLSSLFIAMFAQFQFLPHKMALRPLKTIMTCCMLLLLIMMNEWWRRWEQKWRKTLGQTDFRHTENIRSSCCNNIYTSRQNNLNYWLANSSIHENGFFSTQSKYNHSFF